MKTNSRSIKDAYEAISIAEGFCDEEVTDELSQLAWQYIVDKRLWKSLQGWFGRAAGSLIQEGFIKDTHNDFTKN